MIRLRFIIPKEVIIISASAPASGARRIPVFNTEPMVIEILAEVIRQSKRHPRADQVASALAIRGLPIAQNDVMTVFDHYDIEKKTPDSH